MTPLYNWINRYLPAAITSCIVALVYAALLVLIMTFLIPPGEFDLVYLDLGR